MRDKVKNHKCKFIVAVITFLMVAIVVRVIFKLTFQSPEDTVALSDKAAQYPTVTSFLKWAGQYVPWTVRQWAHVFEYLFVGLTVGVFYGCLIRRTWIVILASGASCALISFVDQYVRIYIVGRHFDRFDLVLDALGYGTMILIVCIMHGVIMHGKKNR